MNCGTTHIMRAYTRQRPALAALACLLTSCGGGSGRPATLVSIVVSPAAPTLAVGTTQPFTATGMGSDGSMSNLTMSATWSSSNTACVTVTNGGVAATVGQNCEATITAASGGLSGTAAVSVPKLYAGGGMVIGGGLRASAITVADFNGDGKLDLAMADDAVGESAGIYVSLGNGDGTFRSVPGPDIPLGTGPCALATGHFHGGAPVDLVISAPSGVYLSAGNGAGALAAAVLVGGAASGCALAVGDLNGDGKPDLVVAGGSTVWVLLGDGNGGFSAPLSFEAGPGASSVAVGDFRGNGKLDLAVGNSDGTVSVLLGDGMGNFSPATNYNLASTHNANSVAVADFNGDGKLDLAVATQDGVSILLGDGTGSFAAAQLVAAGTIPNSMIVGDFNGDGHADLAIASGNFRGPCGPNASTGAAGCVALVFGTGTGSFSAPAYINNWGYTAPWAIASGDFNGDGKPDLVVLIGVMVQGGVVLIHQ
jgi:hypothetical protein